MTLDEGAVGSCAITNTDVAPTLALNKTVVNNSGGNAVENDFVLSATPTTGAITDAGGDVPATTAVANRVYTLSETKLTGYTAGAWTCTGTGIKNFNVAAKTVGLSRGAVVSCTITNTDSLTSPTGTTVQRWVLHDTLTISRDPPCAGCRRPPRDVPLYSDADCATASRSATKSSAS